MTRCAEQISARAAVICALCFEGLRTIEVRRIRPQDLKGKILYVRGKGRKSYDQSVPLTEATADLLREYNRQYAGSWTFEGYKGKPINTRTIRRIFDDIRDCAGNKINGRSAHVARHTYAKEAREAGKTIGEIRKHLRHKSNEMTRHYIEESRIIAPATEAEAG